MASYAAIASKPGVLVVPPPMPPMQPMPPVAPVSSEGQGSLEKEITEWITRMAEVKTAPETLTRLIEGLRREMEMPTGPSGFRGGAAASASANANATGSSSHRNFGMSATTASSSTHTNWRNGFSGNQRFSSTNSAFDTRNNGTATNDTAHPPPVRSRVNNAGRYQSRFKSSGNIEDKILNTVIGNKLNAFTPLTYNDTRDFIYQIIDSGETEFTRDFIEKVFVKAVVEDLYCALFAKLIAEIASRYPVIYEEMNKYHKEFLKIFDNVREDSEAEYADLVKEKQYRMGYGQFIAELAGLNALENSHLFTMVRTIINKIHTISAEENKVKTVEEFIDCIVRLTKGLQTCSPTFFKSVKGELREIMIGPLEEVIARSTPRPSLSNKARFGLMDLKDIIA